MILIHICCADCGLKLIESLKRETVAGDSRISLFFYNPNIHPESEWHARLKAVQAVFKDTPYDLIVANWTPRDFFDGLKMKMNQNTAFSVNEKKDRCPFCWELRLRKTYEYAKNNMYEYVSSTLFSSSYHDTDMITKIAHSLESETGVKALFPKTIDHCQKTGGFYKQNYEGCVYSLLARMEEKYGIHV